MSEFDLECALKGKRKGGILENWHITEGVNSDGEPATQGHGNVYGDVNWREGTYIHTSVIVNHYVEEGILETRNTYYTLGKPRVVSEADAVPLTDEQLNILLRVMI